MIVFTSMDNKLAKTAELSVSIIEAEKCPTN